MSFTLPPFGTGDLCMCLVLALFFGGRFNFFKSTRREDIESKSDAINSRIPSTRQSKRTRFSR
jgi:hypothetical protein